jgi:anthraniloyl-CoA monooxygenase
VKITVVGAGPAGLYFALLSKRIDPSHDVTVLERNAPEVTFGWGVVFSEDTLTELRDADYPTYLAFDEALVRWSAIDIRYRGRTLRSSGHGFSAISRARLLAILQHRAAELGVELRFEHEIADPTQLEAADLVVAADGVRSVLRAANEKALGTTFETLGSRYVWFGTDLVFDVFTFIFKPTEHGLFQVHAYPFDGSRSTFIVETTEQTWRNAGLDAMSEEESLAFCEELFAEHLGGHRLLSNASVWRTFDTIRNKTWHTGNLVVMGDAAHTAHFSIGSGTKLAIEDAVALAKAFQAHPANLPAAFAEYELERQAPVERFQEAATDSARYFEQVSRYLHFEPEQFAFNLLTRSGRITYANLELRDPAVTNRVDRWLHATPERIVSTPPAFTTCAIGPIVTTNRVVLAPQLPDTGVDGLPGADHLEVLVAAARAGAGMVLAGPVAVSAHGRVSPGSAGCWDERHAQAWADISARVHDAGALLGLRLSHSGRRGSTLPRDRGIDRPLREGGWTTLSPSPIPYAPWMVAPAAVDAERFADVTEDFAAAAALAAGAGADLLFVDCSDGYLLASFLSPLSNQRTDSYGGSLTQRLQFPLDVFAAVRAAWPADNRPVGVRLVVDDRHRAGLTPAVGVEMATAFAGAGATIVDVTAGLSVGTDTAAGDYRRLYQVGLADRVRNEAGVVSIAAGRITTLDEINTVVAAGRADLCVLDPRAYVLQGELSP